MTEFTGGLAVLLWVFLVVFELVFLSAAAGLLMALREAVDDVMHISGPGDAQRLVSVGVLFSWLCGVVALLVMVPLCCVGVIR